MSHHECSHGELVIPNTTLPVRLIDIPGTLGSEGGVSFVTPRDWEFHVISHTWSQSIREFSKRVGQSLITISGDTKQQLYNDAFGGENFGDEAGYQQLMEFLKLLKSDGVKQVWFDALCINQEDGEEKSREIMHMGAYYRHSAGCYVVSHGIGRSYSLLSQNKQGLPRWFSRVWTVQEFLLPTKLTFVVSSLNGTHVTSLVNMHIRDSSAAAFCRCCLDTPVKHPTLRGEENSITSTTHDEEILGAGDDNMLVCSRCTELPLIRRAALKGSPAGEQLYFVDRAVYRHLVIMLYGPLRRKPLGHIHTNLWMLHIDNMYLMLEAKCFACNSASIGNMVRIRDSSVDEDRLLSILCLIGLEGRMQVRAGQTLEEQWIKVAQTIADWKDQLTLFDFCIRDFKCLWRVDCSWIPNFRSDASLAHDKVGQMRLRSAHVQLKEVTPKGGLKLNGRVIHAILAPRPPWTEHVDNKMEPCVDNKMEPWGASHDLMCKCAAHSGEEFIRVHQQGRCHLEISNILSIPLFANVLLESRGHPPTTFILPGCYILSDPQFTHPDECIYCDRVTVGGLHLPFKCMHAFLPLEVQLVLWGVAFKDESSGIVMVCVGSTDHHLHKVGVLQLKLDVLNAIFPATISHVEQSCEFLLGGFGEDAQQFLGGTLQCGCLNKLCGPGVTLDIQ